MSFWNGIKRALGFSGGEDEEDEEYDASVPTYAVVKTPEDNDDADIDPDCRLERRPRKKSQESVMTSSSDESTPSVKATSEAVSATSADSASQPVLSDESLPDDLFDAVIQLFNSTMPEFVATSLSEQSQRKYIYDHISESLRRRIANLTPATPAAIADVATAEQLDDANRHLAEAREEADRLRDELKKARSGADRQKRALTDRINDLDRQLTKLRSEKERILTSRKGENWVDKSVVEEKDGMIKQLEEQIAALKADVEKERTLKEQLEVKAAMTDTMINNLQGEAAKAREELQTANENLAVAAEIQEKLELFEQVKERKDAKIAELNAKVKSLKEELERMRGMLTGDADTVDSLRTENASLRRTIETNLYNQANSELKLRNEIKDLKARLEKAEAEIAAASASPSLMEEQPAVSAPQQRRRRGRPRKQQPLDDALDNTDWLDVPAGSRKFDPDFGYHEPPRRVVPENDAQLSLF